MALKKVKSSKATNKGMGRKNYNIYKLLNYCIAAVWLANGLFCKVLNLVPRHEQIVSRILETEFSREITVIIGFSEIAMAFWIVSGFKARVNAFLQMSIIALMNILELILAPDLLLWGVFNSLFALLFILLIFYNEFIMHKKQLATT